MAGFFSGKIGFSQLYKELTQFYQILIFSDAGLNTPTPIQMQAIPLMMHARELLACAPTGSGKTLAFSLPLLAHLQRPANLGFRALVISPTRELANLRRNLPVGAPFAQPLASS
uniref:ATP-dependent RNA helicase n=1 Tax=Xiphophorus couchianus TaxID=32473 RepID=A0A3B5MI06_9TELE